MFVKVCGITNRDDALAAIGMGAQALGFIFHSKSPRYIEPDSLYPWISKLPENVWKVGVFVDEQPAKVEGICARLHLNIAQLHGKETPAQHPGKVQVWKAFRVTDKAPPAGDYPSDAILLDGPGNGKTFDWSVCQSVSRPLILAGGLNETNVRAAIDQAHPWGVDVASGIEAMPGRKDHARMERFIKAALRQ